MKRILILLFVLLAGMNLLSAVQTGRLAGKITDKLTQKPLGNVQVSVDGTALGISDEAGNYLFENIPVGNHQIDYSRIGYETRTKLNFIIKLNQTMISNVEMSVRSIVIEGVATGSEVFFRETSSAPVSSKTLDIEEIKSQPSGSYDLQRSIQAIPAIVSASDAENEIIVRGGNYGENLFVLDNIEIQNPNHFGFPGTGGGPISMLTPEFVKEIEFYAGAFPARFGDRASSVLNITTRDGNEKKFEAKLDLGMAGYGGNIEGPMTGKGNYIFSYHRSFLSLLSESMGLTAVPNYESIFAKQVVNFSPRTKLTLNFLWGNDWINMIHEDEDTSDGYSSDAGETDIYAKSGQYTVGATLKNIYNKSYSLLTAYRNYVWWDNNLYEAGSNKETKVWTEDTNEAHNKIKYSHFFPGKKLGNFETGMYLNYDEVNTEKFMQPDTLYYYTYLMPDNYDEENIATETLWPDDDGEPMVYTIGENNELKDSISPVKYGGYFQWEDHFGRFTLNAGVRYDYLDYTDEGSIAPRLGARYALTGTSNLSCGAGRQFQNPDYYTLTYDEANKNLKPKYTDQVVLGIDKLLAKDIKLSVETYYKKYYDVPISISFASPDSLDSSSEEDNTGKGYAKGIEFFLQKKVKDNFWGTVSYAYSEANAYDPRDHTGEKEYSWDFDYRNVFTGILGYKIEFMKYDWYETHRKWMQFCGFLPFIPSDETEISVKYRYLGGKPYTEMTYHPEIRMWLLAEDAEINSSRFDPYQRLDFHISHKWFENKVTISSYWEVDNILNTKNLWQYNYLGDGTTEDVYQWGRMIIGGLMVEF